VTVVVDQSRSVNMKWRMQMKNLLISQKLHKALAGKEQKPVSMKDEDWEELDLEA